MPFGHTIFLLMQHSMVTTGEQLVAMSQKRAASLQTITSQQTKKESILTKLEFKKL